MRKINIATGDSARALYWRNQTVSFDDLCNKLSQTLRTAETTEEYQSMDSKARQVAKDHGGFVAGILRDGKRKRSCIEKRSMLTLDVDNASTDFIDTFVMLSPYSACLYTTHSHTPEKPRLRILVPLTRDISVEEYIAISRYYADSWGIDQFDPCSFLPQQLMFWPSTPCDGEYIFKQIPGAWLDPDAFLSLHPDWIDSRNLPMTSEEGEVRQINIQKQADPLIKDGIVGTFCRAFSIRKAIHHFLFDIYKPSVSAGRYDYAPGEGSAGVQIYEEKFAFSHHATDPAYNQLLNAFDLVRIHRFGTGDDSFEKMGEFANTLEEVQEQRKNDQYLEAVNDFSQKSESTTHESVENQNEPDCVKNAPTLSKASTQESVDYEIISLFFSGDKSSDDKAGNNDSYTDDPGGHSHPDWKYHLQYNANGALINSVDNLLLILCYDQDYKNIAYNEMAHRIQLTGPVPWNHSEDDPAWRDADTAQLKARIDHFYTAFSQRNYEVAFTKIIDDRRFHPLREYLYALKPWDRIPRVESLLIDYLGADDNVYTRTVTRKTLVAAVARVFHPGIKFDTVLVLVGDQGIGKSTLFNKLAGVYFSDSLSLTDMKDKTAAEKLQGIWIMEIGEMAGMKKAEIETVKSFISRRDDNYRASYGKTVESHLRQCIIVGTSNAKSGFLRDITGNRRFWPVKTPGNAAKSVWDLTEDIIDQIWAECIYYFHQHESLYLDKEVEQMAASAQKEAMETDERTGLVITYLDTLIPDNWSTMTREERKDFLSGNQSFDNKREGTVLRTTVSNMEIWCECFCRDPSSLKKSDSYEIAAIMKKIDGWERSDVKTVTIYGRQRVYVRV